MGRITVKKACRLVGVWDLALTLPFALPMINIRVIHMLSVLHRHLTPDVPFPDFHDIHVFFVQLFGILAVLWALVRIHKPSACLAFYDTLGRLAVASIMLYYSFAETSKAILLFSASEIVFGLLQAVVLFKEKLSRSLKRKKKEA